MGVVTVTLDKCMNLRDKDGVGRSDPYVSSFSTHSYFDRSLDPFGTDRLNSFVHLGSSLARNWSIPFVRMYSTMPRSCLPNFCHSVLEIDT
jgi:hypothetical protein